MIPPQGKIQSMDKEEIVNKISDQFSTLSAECQQDLIKTVRSLSPKKDTVLVKEGQYSDKTYFIVKGCALSLIHI